MFFVTLLALSILLNLLGRWQRRVDDYHHELILADLREAEELGTDKPIAQHPQIDEQACIGCGSCVAACPESGVLAIVGGVAKVVHGSRCIGHARCAEVCPVGAIVVGLGDTSQRTDIPQLSETLETSVPGIFIAGELGGMALIRVAVEEGRRAMANIVSQLWFDEESQSDPDLFDVLIVGSGPAGLSASLEASRSGVRFITIDQDGLGGTVRKYPRRKLTLTGPMELPRFGRVNRLEFLKEELLEFWQELVDRYELNIKEGVKLIGVGGVPDRFEVETSTGVIRTRRILLALGRRGTPRRLGVPGEDREKVLYQLVDAGTYDDEDVLVVGGGDSGIEAALAVASQPRNRVAISYRRDEFFRIKERNRQHLEEFVEAGRVQLYLGTEVEHIEEEAVTLRTRDGETFDLPNSFVFVCAGGEPPYPLLHSMGVEFGGRGVHAATELAIEESATQKRGIDATQSEADAPPESEAVS